MKFDSFVLATAILAIIPVTAIAQNSTQPTREQVRQQLIALEQSGYRPGSASNINYPDDLQAAEQRVASARTSTASAANTQPVSVAQDQTQLFASRTTQLTSTTTQKK